MKKQKIILVLLLLVLTLCVEASGEAIGPDFLLSGNTEGPAVFTISAPEYGKLAQFGDDRRESLNRLLKHLSLEFHIDEASSQTAVAVDGEKLFAVTETAGEKGTGVAYSFEPDTVLLYQEENGAEEGDSLRRFLDSEFCLINRLMDGLYDTALQIAGAFPEMTRESKESLNYKGFGKAVRRVTIQFSAEYTEEHFPEALARLAGTEECASFLRKLIFSGSQRIILMFDEENRILRIGYDGAAGFSAETLRKVSVSWRCLHTAELKKDHLELKTPSVKGYDRYNATYDRETDLSDPENHRLSWNFQLDLKEGQIRKKVQYSAELATTEGVLGGKIIYSGKQDGQETRFTIVPDLRKENGAEYDGTIEITRNSGKIVTSSVKFGVHAAPGNGVEPAETADARVLASQSTEGIAAAERLQNRMYGIVIGRLILLPKEDTEYLSRDIPGEEWNSLIQSLN